MPAIEVTSNDHFSSLVGKGVVVLDFWAEWCKPCGPMNATFDQLSGNYPSVKFLKIDAENLSDITEKYDVSSVPTFVFLKDGKVLDKVAGANGPDLVSKLSKYGADTATTTTTAASSPEDLKSRLEKLVNFAPVMLFMKGTPESPQCGFSNKISDILKKNNVKFSSFNILSDDEVRQGLKEFSNWPTYPQLYVEGKLIGGLDIVKEMAEDGDLDSVIPASARGSTSTTTTTTSTATTTETPAPKEDLNTRLVKLINKEPVMLFMKGNPEAPKCGFSGKIVEILKSQGAKYGSFDILSDEEVRNGLKAYSNWPTYPQLYVNGKLVGGLDIVKEMAEEGELKDLLASA